MFWLLTTLAFSTGLLASYLKFNSQFGGKVTKDLQKRYAQSPNWKGSSFKNLSHTTLTIDPKKMPGIIKEQLFNRQARMPPKPIPIEDFSAIHTKSEQPRFVWFGHSALLLQLDGKNILIDPMLGPDASPVGPVRTKRFSSNSLEIIDKLPPIDAILLTHDHYDHLDYDSIQKLKDKVDTYYVALGISRHLERWEIPQAQITELDWWEDFQIGDTKVTFTPSRHFSGRGLTDRAKCLWGGWVFQTDKHRIYWSGDGGYDSHYKTIGEKFGPFDWAFMECGQYNENWHQIHNHPEEAVQGGVDAGAKVLIPVHWGGFALAMHSWKEPVERFVAETERIGVEVCIPKIGEVVEMGRERETNSWYKKYS